MKTLFFYKDESWRKYVEDKLSGLDVVYYQGRLQDHADLEDKDAEILCVFVESSVGAEEMNRFPNLKHICTRSTGFSHIDLTEAEKRGVSVSNVPTYGDNTVAEHAFALLLALSRKIYDAYSQVAEHGSFEQDKLQGFDLAGKTIGIVGTGNIGRHAVTMANGFGMNILGFDIHENEELVSKYSLKYVSLEELLAQSDVVTLHVPYNKHTHHMINNENLDKLKKGMYLINTSRGEVVETASLVRGLEEGIIAGAGLDVLEEEGALMSDDDIELLYKGHPEAETLRTLLADHYFIDHPNVLITPHIAFNTKEAVQRRLDTSVENIKAFESGSPINIVEVK